MLGVANNQVDVAFLEFASPSIENALFELFKDHVTEVIVLPYFLSAGNHVVRDIPAEISKVLAQWPDKKITLLPKVNKAKKIDKNNFNINDASEAFTSIVASGRSRGIIISTVSSILTLLF